MVNKVHDFAELQSAFVSSEPDVEIIVEDDIEITDTLQPAGTIQTMLLTSGEAGRKTLTRTMYDGVIIHLVDPISFTMEYLVLDGKNGGNDDYPASLIYSEDANSSVTVGEGVELRDNHSHWGGGIFVSYGFLIVKDNAQITHCTAETSGGGIYLLAADNGIMYVGRLNPEHFQGFLPLFTNEVIITDQQISHINNRHPGVFERVSSSLATIVNDPDYVAKDERYENTAILFKEVIVENFDEHILLVLRLKQGTDDLKYMNSIITLWAVSKYRWDAYLRNYHLLYIKE